MTDIQDFMEVYYHYRPAEMLTIEEFNNWKGCNGYESDWDYPLEEFDIIADNKKENGCKYVPVRFSDGSDAYDYRFCEIPQ